MKYRSYVLWTVLYGVLAIAGIVGAVFFFLEKDWFLFVVNLLIVYVAADNFFCGTHLKKCGIPVQSHYVIPPFLKGHK